MFLFDIYTSLSSSELCFFFLDYVISLSFSIPFEEKTRGAVAEFFSLYHARAGFVLF